MGAGPDVERLSFGVLGTLEVRRSSQILPVRGRRERAVLAVLLVHANRVVSADTLLEEVWEGNPPEAAGAALRVHISRLRKALSERVTGDAVVETRAPGYILHVEPDAYDAARFEVALGPAREVSASDPEAASSALAEALALWRGPAFADVAGPPSVAAEAARLEEVRLGAIEDRVAADLACGRHREIVGELEALVGTYPLREALWAAWILALYRCGRQADALRSYQRLRTQLAGELGIDPSPELRRLEQDVLNQDPKLDWVPAVRPDRDAATGVVTLLFTDLAGSTEVFDRLGDARASVLRREHLAILRRAVKSHDGEEVKSLGDGLMAVFSSAVSGVEAAVAAQQAVARHNRLHDDRKLRLRIGLHLGEPVRDENDYFGTPVVVASRLCAAADTGQIVASSLVRSLAEPRGGFGFRDLGALALKGLADPVEACEVCWEEQAVSAFPLPPALAEEPAFVGRDGELSQIAAAWQAAERGRRGVVLVAGEPGIGKTSLVAHASRGAHATGAVVLFGHCDEESLIPFQPFVEALAHFVNLSPPEELAAYLGKQAADLALLVPELRRRLPDVDLPKASGTGPESERYRLFEAVPALLAAVAKDTPVVLVLDDLHWADRATLQLLIHTIRRTASTALLVLGTYRDTDLVRTHPMAEALVDLRRLDAVDRLILRGLSREEVAKLVAGAGSPESADSEFVDALWGQSEGSPLFIREILRHLCDIEVVEETPKGGFRPRRRVAQLGIPEGVKELIGRRLTRLSEDANAVLRTASVMGREFRSDVVGSVSRIDLDDVLDALDEAAAAGVVAEVPGMVGQYAFTHALVRETLYGELSTTRRVRLHQRVGEVVEGLAGENPGPYLSELAFHFAQAAVVAGQAGKAIDYASRAGDRAMALVAYEEAARHYATALEVAEDADAPQERHADLLLAMGRAQWRAKDHRVARQTFEQAAAAARALGDGRRLAEAALGYAGAGIRWLWVELGVVNERAVHLLEEALAALGSGDSPERAKVLGCLASELHFVEGADERCDDLSRDALAMARRLADPRTVAYVLSARNVAVLGPKTAEERLANANEALGLAEDLSDTAVAMFARGSRVLCFLELDRIAEARSEVEAAVELARRMRDPVTLSICLHHQAALMHPEGRFAEAEQLHNEAAQIAFEAHDPNAVLFWGAATLALRWYQGRLAELAGAALSSLEYWYHNVVSTSMARSGNASFVFVYVGGGNDEETRRHLAELDLDAVIPGVMQSWLLFAFAQAAIRVGDSARSAAIYNRLLPLADRNVTIGGLACFGAVSETLGMLASVMGRPADAETHLTAALGRYRTNGWAALVAHAEVELAGVLARAGDPDSRARAVTLVEEAEGRARELGMHAVERAAEALTTSLHGGSPPPPPTALHLSLRDRARAKVAGGGRRIMSRMARGASDEDLTRRFGSPLAQRALFSAMVRTFQPALALGFEGDIEFELRQLSEGGDVLPPAWWTIEVRGSKAGARHGRSVAPALTMRLDVADFVRLAAGEPAIRTALEGRVEYQGDVYLAARIGDLFGGVELAEVLNLAERSYGEAGDRGIGN